MLDWQGLADRGTTLVVYMGGGTAATFAARLVAEGLPANTPAVAVASISRSNEARWHGTLASLAEASGVAENGPLLIGIGAAFAGRSIEDADISLSDAALMS